MTTTHILTALGRTHYAPSENPYVYVSTKPGYEKQPMVVWAGDSSHQLSDVALLWAEQQQLRSAHVREDGRVEIREYQTPRIYRIPAHDRLLYAAAHGGEDSAWEQVGWTEGYSFSAYTEGPPLPTRVEWKGQDYPRRVAGLIINQRVLVVRGSSAERVQAGWIYPPGARESGHVYAHPYRGRII